MRNVSRDTYIARTLESVGWDDIDVGTPDRYPTLHLETVNTGEDHVHIQIEIPPNITIAAVVQALKARASIVLKKKFKFIREMYLDGSIWSVGYFVSMIGLDE